ncbi:ribosomal-processing cysteine protease Prp [Qiania dongpingensis]|nr:ribosomal-processing cysteine protease Prp [Qiania dongpingensis]
MKTMITVKVKIDSDGRYRGFEVKGHAGFAPAGEDIVCAAVSVLTQNTINAIETFTKDDISYSADDGYLECSLPGMVSEESKLLLNALMLGLESVEESYRTDKKGNQLICILTEEV